MIRVAVVVMLVTAQLTQTVLIIVEPQVRGRLVPLARQRTAVFVQAVLVTVVTRRLV